MEKKSEFIHAMKIAQSVTNMTCIADKHLIPKQLKKTTKYTNKDRNNVHFLYSNGMSIHGISREIPMSRRMVQFILFPERAELAKKNFASRQKDGRYKYTTAEQTKKVRECRQRKMQILDKLIIK